MKKKNLKTQNPYIDHIIKICSATQSISKRGVTRLCGSGVYCSFVRKFWGDAGTLSQKRLRGGKGGGETELNLKIKNF